MVQMTRKTLITKYFAICYRCAFQDDSQLNRKIVRRILESSKDVIPELNIIEADDGTTAIEEVKKQMQANINFDFIFIDFVMVSYMAL